MLHHPEQLLQNNEQWLALKGTSGKEKKDFMGGRSANQGFDQVSKDSISNKPQQQFAIVCNAKGICQAEATFTQPISLLFPELLTLNLHEQQQNPSLLFLLRSSLLFRGIFVNKHIICLFTLSKHL